MTEYFGRRDPVPMTPEEMVRWLAQAVPGMAVPDGFLLGEALAELARRVVRIEERLRLLGGI